MQVKKTIYLKRMCIALNKNDSSLKKIISIGTRKTKHIQQNQHSKAIERLIDTDGLVLDLENYRELATVDILVLTLLVFCKTRKF